MNSTVIPLKTIYQNEKKKRSSPIIQIRTKTVETSSGIFDPETSTPPSDFMKVLKDRMNVYFPKQGIGSS